MFERKPSITQISMFISGILILLAALSIPMTVYADDPNPPPDNGKCTSCHEDLYFLHDTGNWFCLKESPMTCVDCHGGDPAAMTEEAAHANLAKHPVINDDVAKCQQCHPDQCDERVELFKQTSGISNIRVAVPYTPMAASETSKTIPVTGEQKDKTNPWLNVIEVFTVLVVGTAGFFIYRYYSNWLAYRGK